MYNLTSNQYYGGLNRRFDRRARLLTRLGFVSNLVETDLRVFTRTRHARKVNIPAAVLTHADNRAWHEVLASRLYR
jgi:hypothetical protein